MLVTLKEALKDAREKKYAVGLFNTTNLEMAKGVIAAAEETRSPVIIGTAEALLPYAGLEELTYFLKPMAEKATVPIVLHLDHGLTTDTIKHAIDLGFSSVMYDCSELSFEDNAKNVAEIVKLAHAKNVSVEAELGHVGSSHDSAESDGGENDSVYTEPKEVVKFIEETDCDALAISIGTIHGAYKRTPKLNIDILKEINAVSSRPLVLHGGSGLSDDDFKNCIQNGISKVNIFTDVNTAAAKAIYDNYKAGDGITALNLKVIEAVKNATMKKMELFSSAGKA